MPSQLLLSGYERPVRQAGRRQSIDSKTLPVPQAERLRAILAVLKRSSVPLTASEIAGKALLHNHDNMTGEDLMVLLNEGKVRRVGGTWAIAWEVVDG